MRDQPFGFDPLLARLVRWHGLDGCRLYLERLRWPGGPECPRCESSDILWLENRRRHNCREMPLPKFRVTAGAVFHDSHLSLRKWFVAISLMLGSDRGISASRLQEMLGGSYKTRLVSRAPDPVCDGPRSRRSWGPGCLSAGSRRLRARRSPRRRLRSDDGVDAPAGWPLLRLLIAGARTAA